MEAYKLFIMSFQFYVYCRHQCNFLLFQDIFRCWVKKHPVSKSRLKDGTLAKIILSKESTVEVDFTEHSDANPLSRKMGLLRWQHNPERDWGPKARATRGDKSNLDALRKKGSQKAKEKKRKVNDMASDNHIKYMCASLMIKSNFLFVNTM